MNKNAVLEKACTMDCSAAARGICPFYGQEKFDKCQRVKDFNKNACEKKVDFYIGG